MKLLIKQRIFSWRDSYDVYDESGEAKYTVKSTEGAEERFKSSLPFLSRGMKSIITAGVWKGMFLAGTMMFTTDTAS